MKRQHVKDKMIGSRSRADESKFLRKRKGYSIRIDVLDSKIKKVAEIRKLSHAGLADLGI